MDKEQDPKISFQPITPGLGFHPFAEGLPYAPVAPASKPSTSNLNNLGTGTGAVAAGPARFVTTPKLEARSAVIAPALTPAPTQNRDSITPTPSPISRFEADTLGEHYLSRRLTAYLLDFALHLTLCIMALCAAVFTGALNGDSLLSNSFFPLLCVFLLGVHWALMTAQEVAFGTTLGKRALGLRLEKEGESAPFRILIRALLFPISFGLAGLGILAAVVDPEKRCWHDRWSGLQPHRI